MNSISRMRSAAVRAVADAVERDRQERTQASGALLIATRRWLIEIDLYMERVKP